MKQITSLSLLGIFSLILLTSINVSYAETDPSILLKLAMRAQEQVENQVSSLDSVPLSVEKLMEEGNENVLSIRSALEDEDLNKAKESFLNAMRVFKEISLILSEQPSQEVAVKTTDEPQPDYLSEIQRIKGYVQTLKNAAAAYDADINFALIDEFIQQTEEKIRGENSSEISHAIDDLKQMINDITNTIKEYADEKSSQRAQAYAQQYLDQLDRLIENAKKTNVSEDIIFKLEEAKEKLSSATDPKEIVLEIKEIISLKKQFELTAHDRMEGRLIQVERMIERASQSGIISEDDIQDLNSIMQHIRTLLSDGMFEEANDQLKDVMKKITDLQKKH